MKTEERHLNMIEDARRGIFPPDHRYDFSGANLEEADLSGINLARSSFVGANLRGADLTKSTLVGADFAGADLCEADLSEADCSKAHFIRARMRSTRATYSKMMLADFEMTELEGADFTGSDLSRVNFDHCKADRAIFDKTKIHGGSRIRFSDFDRTMFREADTSGLTIFQSTFHSAYLGQAMLHDALVRRSSFRRAVFAGANLFYSSFLNCDFAGANMIEAKMDTASFLGSELPRRKFLPEDFFYWEGAEYGPRKRRPIVRTIDGDLAVFFGCIEGPSVEACKPELGTRTNAWIHDDGMTEAEAELHFAIAIESAERGVRIAMGQWGLDVRE